MLTKIDRIRLSIQRSSTLAVKSSPEAVLFSKLLLVSAVPCAKYTDYVTMLRNLSTSSGGMIQHGISIKRFLVVAVSLPFPHHTPNNTKAQFYFHSLSFISLFPYLICRFYLRYNPTLYIP